MKVFVALACLVAAALAAPESDAQLWNAYGSIYSPYTTAAAWNGWTSPYVNTLGYSSLVSPYYNTLGYRYIAKRDAESDAQIYSAYGSVLPYTARAWGYRAAAISPYYNTLGYSSLVSPYYNTLGYRYIAKREADAESDAQLITPYGIAGLNAWNYASYMPYTTYSTAAVVAKPIVYSKPVVAAAAVATAAQHPLSTSPVALNNLASPAYPAVPGAYAAAGRYEANSAGVVHKAKREAESDAQLYLNTPYTYGNLAYNAYNLYNPYRFTAAYTTPYATRFYNGLYL